MRRRDKCSKRWIRAPDLFPGREAHRQMAEHQDMGLRSILRGQVCRTEWPFLSRRRVPSVICHCRLDPKVHPPALCPMCPYSCAPRPVCITGWTFIPSEMYGSFPTSQQDVQASEFREKLHWRASRWCSWAVIRYQNRVPTHKTPDVTEEDSSDCKQMQ